MKQNKKSPIYSYITHYCEAEDGGLIASIVFQNASRDIVLIGPNPHLLDDWDT